MGGAVPSTLAATPPRVWVCLVKTIWTNHELQPGALALFHTELAALGYRLIQSAASTRSVLAVGASDPALAEADIAYGQPDVADCLRLPRDGLARRAGPALLDHLDRALGHRPDPRAPFVPLPRFASRVVLPVPVHEVEPLLFAARRLVGELAGFLAGRTAGVTRFTLRLEHERRPPTCVPIELSMPNRDAAHLTALVRERLSRTALPAATEAIALDCDETQQLAPRNFTLFASDEVTTEHRVALVERLRARLGHDAVHGLEFVPRHRPELAHHESEPGHAIRPTATPPRPLWLLATPEPVASAALHPLAGPERIESGWWDGRDAQRDYFIATRTDGSVVWVYRELDDSAVRWFVQGWFA